MRTRLMMAVGSAGALAALAGLGAAPALAGTSAPNISLSISPPALHTSQHDVREHIVLSNLSPTTSVKISTSAITITGADGSCMASAPPTWIHVEPASFTIRAGGHRRATVRITAPKGVTGSFDLAAVFSAKPASSTAQTGFAVSGAIGQRILLSYGPVKAVSCVQQVKKTTSHKVALAASRSSSALPIAVGLALAVLLAASFLVARKRFQGLNTRE